MDWKTWTARNNPSDAIPVSIFAFSDSVTTVSRVLWDGLPSDFSFPTTSTTLSIATTSVTADSGARLLINGLDSNWDIITETVTLGGITPVVTTNSFLRINSMIITAPATGQVSNIGTITAKKNSTTLAQINPTIGRTQGGYYSVPRNYTWFLYSVNCYSGDAAANGKYCKFDARITNNALTQPVTYYLLQTTFLDEFNVQRLVPQLQGEKTDLKWEFSVSQGTQSCSIIVQAMLLKNS